MRILGHKIGELMERGPKLEVSTPMQTIPIMLNLLGPNPVFLLQLQTMGSVSFVSL